MRRLAAGLARGTLVAGLLTLQLTFKCVCVVEGV
jgi:hypothetical protein